MKTISLSAKVRFTLSTSSPSNIPRELGANDAATGNHEVGLGPIFELRRPECKVRALVS